jgi:signal transduction histidine kinase
MRSSLGDVIDDALRLHADSYLLSGIELRREGVGGQRFSSEPHKILQIVVNLLGNARHAVIASDRLDKRLIIRVMPPAEGRIRLQIEDNGAGIPVESQARIFSQGFTSKKDGHGFGLHMSAITAKGLGGSLSFTSEGAGKGATFTLELPLLIEEPQLEAAS